MIELLNELFVGKKVYLTRFDEQNVFHIVFLLYQSAFMFIRCITHHCGTLHILNCISKGL